MKRPIRELTFFVVALAVVALDQVSKFFIRANQDILPIPEEGFFRITYGTNPGGVFGLFNNQAFLITLAAIVGVVAVLVYSRYPIFNRAPVRIALGLLLGGAVGNLIDRIRFGEVVDFIDVGFGHYRWPTFNLADSAIVVGVVIIIFYFLLMARRERSLSRRDE